ncbi:MAG: YciI family protein [Bryobacterales bacterium]|nr:YciI family protein [Bryobacterales bacterium]
MKYILLIYGNEAVWAGASEEERQRVYTEHAAYGEALQRAGALRGGEELLPTAHATTVRFQGGRKTIQDGPFAETKEHLGGYYVIEVENLDEALEWASKMPGMTSGCVEVRPLAAPPEQGRTHVPSRTQDSRPAQRADAVAHKPVPFAAPPISIEWATCCIRPISRHTTQSDCAALLPIAQPLPKLQAFAALRAPRRASKWGTQLWSHGGHAVLDSPARTGTNKPSPKWH